MTEPIKLSDILDTLPVEPATMSIESLREFLEQVDVEMKRRGFNKDNEASRRSEIMTAEDYALRVGPCSD